MLIDVNLDNHILEVQKELEEFNYLEFKSRIKSLFGLSIVPSKSKLKDIAIVMRVCMDYILDNKDKIIKKEYDTSRTIGYINKTLHCGDVSSFRVVYNDESKTFGYKVILKLENEEDEYSINDKICIDELSYLTISDIADMLHLIKNED